MTADSVGYLLDTNILLHLLRGNALGRHIDDPFKLRSTLSYCAISVVTVGEMYALVRRLDWGTRRMATLSMLLDEIPWININDPALLRAYGEIDAYSDSVGRPMGKNDVWIAATSHVSQLTLLTADLDFDHLDGRFLTRLWIDPNSAKGP